MFNLTELLVFGTTVALLAILIINNVRLYFANKRIISQVVELALDKLSLQDALDKLSQEVELLNLKETDGFVKFLSESRESAYQYIEEVQGAIESLVAAMDSGLDSEIQAAYQDLVMHMPKEQPND